MIEYLMFAQQQAKKKLINVDFKHISMWFMNKEKIIINHVKRQKAPESSSE